MEWVALQRSGASLARGDHDHAVQTIKSAALNFCDPKKDDSLVVFAVTDSSHDPGPTKGVGLQLKWAYIEPRSKF